MRDGVLSSVLRSAFEFFEKKQVNVRPCYAVAAFAAVTAPPTFAAIVAHAAVSAFSAAMVLSAALDIPRQHNPVTQIWQSLSEQANSQALLQKEAAVVEPPKLALPE
jgi:hypothetical protein